jgi:ABC-type uncharacterized transport system permease subunit
MSFREQVNFQWDDDEVRLVLEQHAELDIYSEHRELYSNMGMRIEYTIFLMMRLKSFRPEIDKNWQPGENAKNIKKSLQ